MAGRRKYKYNPETLFYEMQRPSLRYYLIRALIIPGKYGYCFGVLRILARRPKLKTPRTVRLEREYK